MAIFKPDGNPYTVGGKKNWKSYRPDGVDQDLFNRWDIEQIELAGSPVIYYKASINPDFDKTYMESKDQIVTQAGIRITAQFEPVRPVQDISMFGIDSPDEIIFNFNINQWTDKIKSMPTLRSLIFAEWDKTWWEIIQNDQEQPYKLWEKYRLSVITSKYQRSRTDQEPDRRDAIREQEGPDRSKNIDIF